MFIKDEIKMQTIKWKKKSFTDSVLKKIEGNIGKIIFAYTALIITCTNGFTKVQVESAESINKVNIEKLNFQSSQIEILKAENEQYKNWLLENEKTNPVIYEKFKAMQNQILSLQSKLNSSEANDSTGGGVKNDDGISYHEEYNVYKGRSFMDGQAKVIVGVRNVSPSLQAEISVSEMDGKEMVYNSVAPGKVIPVNEGKYILLVTEVNYLTDRVSFTVKNGGVK